MLVIACSRATAWDPYPPGGGVTGATNPRPAKKPEKAPSKTTTTVAETPAPVSKPAPVADEATGSRAQELQTLLRRQKVCYQLMQIALETNDAELLRKAEQLDERARNIYSERTAALPGFADESGDADMRMLDKRLGSTRTAGRETTQRAAGQSRDTHAVSEARKWEEEP